MTGQLLRRGLLAALSASLIAALACRDSPFGNARDIIGAEMVTADTTLIVGEAAAFQALAIYGLGPGVPTSIGWRTSDTAVAGVSILSDGRGSVTAKAAGTTWIVASIEAFSDSAELTVVGPGAVRWTTTVPAGGALNIAVGLDSLIRVGAASGALTFVSRDGSAGASATGCNGALGPSVDDGGAGYQAGDECSRRLSSSGGEIWASTLGDLDGGVAIAGDGAALLVHSIVDAGGATGAVVASRIAATGAEVWRDTLRALPVLQRTAPAINNLGDIFFTWRAPADSGWVTKVNGLGAVQWTKATPGEPRFSSPAIETNRVVVSYLGGVTSFDAGGAVQWSRQFTQDNPAATDSTAASSPVIDVEGNVYVQTPVGLHAYGPGGTPLWTADSLGGGSQAAGVGTPSILGDTTIVIVRGTNRVCAVDHNTGVPRWCSPVLASDLIGGVAEGVDRSLLVARASGQLIALWNRPSPAILGWPTEGGNNQRTRRQP